MDEVSCTEQTGRRGGTFFGFAREIVGVQPTKKNSLGTHRVPGAMTPTGLQKTAQTVGRCLSPAVPVHIQSKPSPVGEGVNGVDG